jgi:hypothetical protein
LGLFNILHSAVLLVVLVVIGLVLFVHLGDLLATLVRLRRLSPLLHSPVKSAGEPLSVNPVQTLYRQRVTSAQPAAQTVEGIRANLAARFERIEVHTLPLATHEDGAASIQDGPEGTATGTEVRMLAMRHTRAAALRPALMIGLLLTLLVVWLIVLLGWEVTAPVLAPGGEYRFNPQQLQLQYTVSLQGQDVHPVLNIRLGQVDHSLTVTDTRLSLAGVGFQVQTAAPGLHIATLDETPALARAGQAETASSIGLIFPRPGSEESIVLPAQFVGLRIVRMADTQVQQNATPTFMVEVYTGERSQPTQRVEIEATQIADIQVNEQGFILRVLPVPGVVVSARYLPAMWLLWLALLLALLGAAGYWLRPAFILVQVAPWAGNRAVVVVQSDRRQELEQRLMVNS